ncbi:hypothetical protein N431DRAFT_476007 [Stipitochalara longipes BDJ]|nr:hypothetical protein N431DRAFT_476007 [Stipitochalara longipes BDJ]
MDGLSSGASVLAVVSIAVQLADSIKRVYDFWSSVKDAPHSIRAMIGDLKLLGNVLDEIVLSEKNREGGVTGNVLASCQDRINDLLQITNDLEVGLASSSQRTRKWAAVKAVFKEEKMKEFRRALEDIKTTLLLARQSSLDSSLHHRLNEHRELLVNITENVTSLHLQHSGPIADNSSTAPISLRDIARTSTVQLSKGSGANSFLQSALETGMSKVIADVLENMSQEGDFSREMDSRRPPASYQITGAKSLSMVNVTRARRIVISKSLEEKKSIFGSVRVHTRRYKIERQRLLGTTGRAAEEESVSWLTIRPAPWVVAAGLKYGVNMTLWQTSTSWKHSLQTFRPVPNDAEIFKNVQWDDEETVWELISEGKASLWDINDVGRTPLMEAGSQPLPDIEFCRRLIEAGSDPNLMDNSNLTPLRMQVHFWEKPTIDVVRFWLDVMNVDERELLHTLRGLATAARKADNFDPTTSPFVWLWNLLQLKPNMERYEALVHHILYRALPVENKIDNGFLAYVLDLFPNNLDSVPDENRNTVLFRCIQMELYPSAFLLIEKGADLHAAGYDHVVLPRPNNHWHTMTSEFLHTITSRSMLTSQRFFKWRELLLQAGINLLEFSMAAAMETPLIAAGWDEHGLMRLLQLDTGSFKPRSVPQYHSDSDCRCYYGGGCGYLVEIEWMEMLERIRKDEGEDLDAKEGRGRKDSEVEWICERCWHRYKNDLSQVPGRLTREVSRVGEDEDSHFLLSL